MSNEIELSQAEYEAVELKIAQVREEFLSELAKDRNLARLYAEWCELEQMGIDGRRARREAEVLEGGEPAPD